jgi:hypothetical protein
VNDQADKGTEPIFVTSGQEITPTAAPGSQLQYLNPGLADYQNYIASGGITTAVSPDGNTLLLLTAGYNNLADSTGNFIAADSQEYIFVFDISKGAPQQKQVLTLPNSYTGIAFATKFNRIVWQGLKGAAPYPVQRTGVDLRQNRSQPLQHAAALTATGS